MQFIKIAMTKEKILNIVNQNQTRVSELKSDGQSRFVDKMFWTLITVFRMTSIEHEYKHNIPVCTFSHYHPSCSYNNKQKTPPLFAACTTANAVLHNNNNNKKNMFISLHLRYYIDTH